MPTFPSPESDGASADEGTWPWQCLGCRGPLYHDGELCRDCRTVDPFAGEPGLPDALAEFVDWIRVESYPAFLTKITAIAGVEVALTALWLRILLHGPAEVATLLPVFV